MAIKNKPSKKFLGTAAAILTAGAAIALGLYSCNSNKTNPQPVSYQPTKTVYVDRPKIRIAKPKINYNIKIVIPQYDYPAHSRIIVDSPTTYKDLAPKEDKTKVQTNSYPQYMKHVNARNPQIIDEDKDNIGEGISVDPRKLGTHIKYNFVPLGKEVTDCASLGYSQSDFSNRGKNVSSGLNRTGNGLTKLVSLGYWDNREEKAKKDEGNQFLRWGKSIYDIPFGVVQTGVNLIDYPAAGIFGKTLDTTLDLAGGLVNTTVDAGEYFVGVPFKATQSLERIPFEKSNVSQRTYEGLSTVLRFGGNVVLHEVPQEGKYIQIIDRYGKETKIDKGETGATLELLSCIGLDLYSLSSHRGDGNDYTKKEEATGGWGTGGNVGN